MAKRKTATRTISNAGRLKVLTVLASHKSIGLAPTESSVEVDGLVDLEYDQTVARFQVQPERVPVEVGGEVRDYYPDAKVVLRTGVIGYREFKDASVPLKPEVAMKLDAARAQMRSGGYQLDTVQSDQLRVGYRMENLHLLRRYARWPTPQRLREQVLGAMEAKPRQTLGDLRTLVGTANLGGLYRMLWDKQVGIDLVSERLSARTPVWSVQS